MGKANPFRYRGYYYDRETGFYYLQSRYYDPEICRFISADNLELVPTLSQTAGQLNLYAYCNNNPVMYSDPSGEFALTAFAISMIIGVGSGMLFGGVVSGITAYQEGRRGWELFGSIAGGVITGGAMGAAMVLGGAAGLAATGASIAGYSLSAGAALGLSVAIGAGANTMSYLIVNGSHNDKNITLQGTIKSFVCGGFQGGLTFVSGFIGGKNGLFNKLGNFNTIDAFYVNMLANTGKISSLAALFYGTSMLFGDTLTKLFYLSSTAAGGRIFINYLFSLIPN